MPMLTAGVPRVASRPAGPVPRDWPSLVSPGVHLQHDHVAVPPPSVRTERSTCLHALPPRVLRLVTAGPANSTPPLPRCSVRRTLASVALLLALAPAALLAQTREITGKVTQAGSGTPVTEATIGIVGAQLGV